MFTLRHQKKIPCDIVVVVGIHVNKIVGKTGEGFFCPLHAIEKNKKSWLWLQRRCQNFEGAFKIPWSKDLMHRAYVVAASYVHGYRHWRGMYGLQHVQVALFHRWRKGIGLANFFFRAGYILCIDIIAAEVGGLFQGKYVRIKIANAVGIPIES